MRRFSTAVGLGAALLMGCPVPPGTPGDHGLIVFEGLDHPVYAVGAQLRVDLSFVDPDLSTEELGIISTEPAAWSVAWVDARRQIMLEAVGEGWSVIQVLSGEGGLVDEVAVEARVAQSLMLQTPAGLDPSRNVVSTWTGSGELTLLEGGSADVSLWPVALDGRLLGGRIRLLTEGLDGPVVLSDIDGRAPSDGLWDGRTNTRLTLAGVTPGRAAGEVRLEGLEQALELSVQVVAPDVIEDIALVVDPSSESESIGWLLARVLDGDGNEVLGAACYFESLLPEVIRIELGGEQEGTCVVGFVREDDGTGIIEVRVAGTMVQRVFEVAEGG